MRTKYSVLWVVFLVLCSMNVYAATLSVDPASVDLVDVPKELPPIEDAPIDTKGTIDYVKNVDAVTRVGVVDVIRRTLVPKMFVGGTEYEIGEQGKTFVTLSIDGQSVDNADCLVQIFYPNNTQWVGYTSMSFLEDGIYYYDFTVTNTTGVYPVEILCSYVSITNVTFPTTITRTLGAGAGAISNLQTVDSSYVGMNENLGDSRRVSAFFNFTTIFNQTTTSLHSISLDFVGIRPQLGSDPASDPLKFWLYNYNTSQYDLIGDDFSYLASDTSKTYTFLDTSKNLSNYIKNGSMAVLINDTVDIIGGDTTSNTILSIDYLALRLKGQQRNDTVALVSGGGELHVTNRFTTLTCPSAQTIAQAVWNSSNRTLTGQVNATIDFGAAATAVWLYPNRTVDLTINITNVTLNINSSAVAAAVWSYENRTITAIIGNQTVNFGISASVFWILLFFVLLGMALVLRKGFMWFGFGLYSLFFGFSIISSTSTIGGLVLVFVGIASMFIANNMRS